MDCAHCSFPNPAWKRRCDRCGRPLHSLGTHLLAWTLAVLVVLFVALLLFAP